MGPTSNDSGDIHFIVSTGTKKPPDPELRKLIRSHVMLGKNRGKILPPKKEKIASPNTVIGSNSDNSSLDHECVNTSLANPTLNIIPRKVGSDLSFIRFADILSIAKKALFPLESCINFGAKEKAWMEALTLDAAYLHAMAFSAQDYFDLLPGRVKSCLDNSARMAAPHVVRTLQLLRERLEMSSEDKVKLIRGSFSTVAVVLFDLSGGLPGLRNIMKLCLEVLRCDVGIALQYGSKPLFFANLLREPYWPYPDFTFHSPTFSLSLESCKFIGSLDTELARAWEVTKQFSTLVNHAAGAHQKLPKEYLLDTMVSVMYPILPMPPDHCEHGSLDEAVRLGLLAYCSSVFLQWAGRNCLVNLQLPELIEDNSGDSSSLSLLLWLLMIGAVSVFSDFYDAWLKPWLRVNIELCGIGDS
ncbi:hypothetical protein GGR53DRAFT_527819 [Hypoxylon sp. FL1150]|nr:hypothetical protein GGR53DRAFT_527819 [Hypoxylon sp. FL1150]